MFVLFSVFQCVASMWHLCFQLYYPFSFYYHLDAPTNPSLLVGGLICCESVTSAVASVPCGGVPLSPSTLTACNLFKCAPVIWLFFNIFFAFICIFFCFIILWLFAGCKSFGVGVLLCHLGIACESQINYWTGLLWKFAPSIIRNYLCFVFVFFS